MDDKENLEAWADALLDQHRSAPPPSREPVAVEDLPPMMRLSVRLGGEVPDREMVERMRRNAERHQRFAAIESVFMLVGVGLLCAFGYAFLSGF